MLLLSHAAALRYKARPAGQAWMGRQPAHGRAWQRVVARQPMAGPRSLPKALGLGYIHAR
jgi:hypothetical protein